MMPRTTLEGAPHGHSETTTRGQHTTHLPQSGARVWEELEALLAHHYIKHVVGEREGHGVSLMPLHARVTSPSDHQHLGVHVKPDDLSTHPKQRHGSPGNHSSATGHVQQSLSRLRLYEIQQAPAQPASMAGTRSRS